jgi:hypothetical protein
MRFDLTDLSLFRHVVDAGSITHGAERANLALAAASARIRNMEQALGTARTSLWLPPARESETWSRRSAPSCWSAAARG